MRFLIKICLIFVIFSPGIFAKLTEYVKWQTLSYKNLPQNELFPYNASVNVPFGTTYYNGRLFVTIPRRNPGVPSSLNVVELNGDPPYLNPLLKSYPDWSHNALNPNTQPSQRIISVYRPRVDKCGRLWFVDTGVLEYPNNMINVQRPSIWIIDLKTDTIVQRFEIPATIVETGRGLAAITVDDADCENSFAYLPDWMNNALLVFSAKDRKIWRFNHNLFFFNPFEGDYNVDGLQFQWNDGIFSVALSKLKPNGFRTAFFHPLSSHGEFTVSTEILRNEQLSTRRVHGSDFKFIGHRGPTSQSGPHYLDTNTNVLFFAEMQNNAVTCWNVKKDLRRVNMDYVKQDNSTLIYPVDLLIDQESTLWVLSNRLPRFIYATLDMSKYNFNIWRENVNEALSDTTCLQ